MAQTPILAPGTTALASSPVVIPSGVTYSFGLYTTGGAVIPPNVGVAIHLDTPGDDQPFASMTPNGPAVQFTGPVELIFKRPVTPVDVGVVQYST